MRRPAPRPRHLFSGEPPAATHLPYWHQRRAPPHPRSRPSPPPLRSPLSFPSSRRLPFAVALPRAAAPLLCCAARKLVEEGEFEAEVMQSDLPMLVDFVADWCGPCRLVAPVVDWASEVRTRALPAAFPGW
ncbi:hypothetical protein VPH35_018637 [Triticum aestivum]